MRTRNDENTDKTSAAAETDSDPEEGTSKGKAKKRKMGMSATKKTSADAETDPAPEDSAPEEGPVLPNRRDTLKWRQNSSAHQ